MSSTKIIFRIIIISGIIALITVTSFAIRIFWPKAKPLTYDKLSLTAISSFYYSGRNLTLANSMSFSDLKERNIYYKFSKVEYPSFYAQVASKIGFGLSDKNEYTGIYQWFRDDSQKDILTLDLTKGELKIVYYGGLGENLNSDSAYTYLSNLLQIKTFSYQVIASNKSDNNVEKVSYRLLFNDKPVYFKYGTEVGAYIVMLNGKIVNATMQLLSKEDYSSGVVESRTNISPDNIYQSNYAVQATSTASYKSSSTLGNEFIPPTYLTVNLLNYSEVYYCYFTADRQNLLLPAYSIKGDYIDEKNNKGTANMVLINIK